MAAHPLGAAQGAGSGLGDAVSNRKPRVDGKIKKQRHSQVPGGARCKMGNLPFTTYVYFRKVPKGLNVYHERYSFGDLNSRNNQIMETTQMSIK